MPIPVSHDFILYPSQQPPAPPESPQSGFSCIWTRRSELDSSPPQPQPPPALPKSSQSGLSWIWRRRRTSRSELGSSSAQPQPPPALPESQLNLPESSQSGFSWTWTSRSELDSSSWQPPPPIGLKSFTYEELESATNGFSESNFVGRGGFGSVYRGFLRDHGIVAIKKHVPNTSGQGVVEFRAEVNTISRVHHRRIVSIVGYYFERPLDLMLVYEFLPNHSLEFHLYGRGTETVDWETRMKIAVGSAKGLTYLHEGCKPRIIHRDIKPSNILLDENFQPRITDFGLARFLPEDDTYVETKVAGTPAYVDPEYICTQRLSEKSDVFAFGVVLFGLITGRKPFNDPEKYPGGHGLDWARPLFSVALQNGNFEEFADARLGNEYNAEEMFRMVSCAANCVRRSAARRPRMSQVVQALEGVSRLDNDDLTNGFYENEETTFGETTEGTYGSVVNTFSSSF